MEGKMQMGSKCLFKTKRNSIYGDLRKREKI